MTAWVEEFSAADEKFRIERHDFRHKMSTIASLVESGQYDQLLPLVNDYADAIAQTRVVKYCSFPVVDAALSAYLQRAQRSGIAVSHKCLFPETLPVREAELATAIANAIENAANACHKLPAQERWLRVQVINIPRFMIQISNSFDGNAEFTEEGLPVRCDGTQGLGTRSIAAFCQKNNVLYEFKAENSTFSLRMIFP